MKRFLVRGFLAAAAALIVFSYGEMSYGAIGCGLGLAFSALVIVICSAPSYQMPLACPILANRDWLAHPWSQEPVKLRPQWS